MNDKSSIVNHEVSKIKVLYAKIIEKPVWNKRYYEILYKEVGKDYECVGYGSYYLSTVRAWREMYFEVVGEEQDRRTKMAGNEYQNLAMRTNDGLGIERIMNMADNLEQGVEDSIPDTGIDLGGIINGLFGLSGEAGELTDMIKKWIFHNSDLDENHAKKELGDVMWYIAMICESFGWSLDEIMQMNIDKLKKRYPDGFDTERANNRSPEDV